MQIIYLPKCEWKYILFLLFFIFSFLQTAIIRWISMNSKDVAQPFLNTYLFSVSDFLAGIPYLIVYLRSRRKSVDQETIEKVESLTLTYTKNGTFIYHQGDRKTKRFYLLLFLVSFFDFASHISSLIFYIVYGRNERSISENNLSSLLIFNSIFIYLLSRVILKTYFYKHHYFSFVINIVCILILAAIDIINIINTDDKGTTGMVLFYIAKKILSIVFYAVEDVIGKQVLMEQFISIYELLLFRAIFGTALVILFSIPFIFINVTDTSNKEPETGIIFGRILNLFDDLNFFKIIMFVITNLFYNIFIWLIIDKFSPSHYSISLILESFGTLIRLWITEPKSVDLPVLRMFIFFILIFVSFIHTELIVINYFDLQKNTKLFLDVIEKEEMSKSTKDNIQNNYGRGSVDIELSFGSSDYDDEANKDYNNQSIG